jgi:hypothetical protein
MTISVRNTARRLPAVVLASPILVAAGVGAGPGTGDRTTAPGVRLVYSGF